MACQRHCVHEEKCPERLGEAFNLMVEPRTLEPGVLTALPAPVLEITWHLLISLESQRVISFSLPVWSLYPNNLPQGQSQASRGS